KAMEKASKKEEKLKALNALYLEIINELNQISESDRTTLSANLKHAYMKMVCEYGNYIKEFTGAER
ncbi:MAG: hypothetical protein IJR47_02035, partial [Clostridia bacterium]|nr:hypothetical protein [Clostridia bacterium]